MLSFFKKAKKVFDLSLCLTDLLGQINHCLLGQTHYVVVKII